MDWKPGLAAALAVTLISAAPAPAPVPMAPPTAAQPYVGAALPDTYRILPPAPVAGTIRYEADRAIFRSTRALQDSPRWSLAQGDVSQPGIFKGLACAVGVEITREGTPRTAALFARMAPDASQITNRPKDIYKRQRPYLIDEGPTCIEKSPALSASPDYPSGHNTWGWSVGLILAELVPDRATEILVRARAFGEGRLVCGVHNLSAVEAGRMNASILVAALHGSPEFRGDMDAARQELAAARKAGPAPDPALCAKEAAVTAQQPY